MHYFDLTKKITISFFLYNFSSNKNKVIKFIMVFIKINLLQNNILNTYNKKKQLKQYTKLNKKFIK